MKKKNIRILSALLAGMLCLASCAAKHAAENMDIGMAPGEMYDTSGGSYNYSASADASLTDGYDPQEKAETSTAAPGEKAAAPDSARKLIRNVSLDLETKEFDKFLTALESRISAAGGYVQTSSVRGSGTYRYASVTARIPTQKLDGFCAGVSEAANVVRRTENTDDVTLEYVDTESRLKALQSEYDTLLTILGKCTDLKDVISVQSRITEVLYQIESYKSRLNSLDNLVSYSTVSMSVSEVERETVTEVQTVGQRIAVGLSRTVEDLRRDAEDLLVDLTVNLPYILIWAAILAGAVLAVRAMVRRACRRRANKAQAKPQDPEA